MDDQAKKVEDFHFKVVSQLDDEIVPRYVKYNNSMIRSNSKLFQYLMDFKFKFWTDYLYVVKPFIFFNGIYFYFKFINPEFTAYDLFLTFNIYLGASMIFNGIKAIGEIEKIQDAVEVIHKLSKDTFDAIDDI